MFIENYHILKVKYHGPTNTLGSRIRITSERFEQSITIDYDHSQNAIYDMAANHLIDKGFNIVGKAEGSNHYYLISDTFEPLKKIKE